MDVKVIPEIILCRKDNYSYVTQLPSRNFVTKTIVIDAPDFLPISKFIDENGLSLDFILSTHHHGDHVDGNLQLKNKFKSKIYGAGSDAARIPGIDYKISSGETLDIDGYNIETFMVPGHTDHHIVYHFVEDKILFTGDTLFSMGCGRLFEGSYEEMFASLQRIKALPLDTKIYCGHEYSEKNAQFAMMVEPSNMDIKNRFEEVLVLRKKQRPTVPTTLEMELKINPFLRASSVDEFKKLRQLRDSF